MSVTITSVSGTDIKALGNIPLSEDMYTKGQVETRLDAFGAVVSEQIASAVSTAWKAGGSKAPTDLTSALLVAANEGKVYNMSASGTTDTNFVEGSGKPYLAGTDIAVINTGTTASPVYKFNVLAALDSSVVKKIVLGSGGSELTPTNGAVTIPYADTDADGILTAGEYDSLFGEDGISGEVSGLSENVGSLSGDVSDLRDTIYGESGSSGLSGAVEELQCGMSDCITSVTIGETTYSGGGNIDITSGVYVSVSTDSGTVGATAGNVIDIHGDGGITVTQGSGGDSVIVDGGTISGVASGAAAAVSGLKNFSKVTVKDSSGNTVTNGTITPASNADDTFGFKAGNHVTLSTSGKYVVIGTSGGGTVTDGKISGGSSLLSGTTIVIPVASTSAKGVTQLTDSVSNSTTTAITPNAVSGAISGVNSGLATKITGSSLHTALSGSGLQNGTGSTNNTIYALINALHSVDGQHT